MGQMLGKYVSLDTLTESDVAKTHNIDNTPCPAAMAQLEKLSTTLIDKIVDKAIQNGFSINDFRVNSSYRCPAVNNLIPGASSTSQHMKGEAIDISFGNATSNKKLFNLIVQMVKNKELTVGQLIDEENFRWVHVSLGTKNEYLKYVNKKNVNKGKFISIMDI